MRFHWWSRHKRYAEIVTSFHESNFMTLHMLDCALWSVDLIDHWHRLTWVPMELILPDKFGGELYQMTTTHNPPTESHDRATSSHSQIPAFASILETGDQILVKNVQFINMLLLCKNKNYLPSIWQAWMVSKWLISSSSLAWILSSRSCIVYWKQKKNSLTRFRLKMCLVQ